MMMMMRVQIVQKYIYTRKAVACKTVRFLLRIKSVSVVCVLMAAEIEITFFLAKAAKKFTHLPTVRVGFYI